MAGRTVLLLVAAINCVYAQLQNGSLPQVWNAAEANCVSAPDWTVHEYNENFYILRESGCLNYEKPFVYLILGAERALLLDTGAGKPNIAPVVFGILEKRGRPRELTVIHSHGHRDHTAGDAEFSNKPGARLITADVADISKSCNIANWPEGTGTLELGNRTLDVVPIPGHDAVSIALYDGTTGILLTGDSMYPGRLYVSDWDLYAKSIRRLVEFTRTRPVSHVLGTHIEQSRTPFRDYIVGTRYQPDEHTLDLGRAHLLEIDEALRGAAGKPEKIALRDVTIVPRGTNVTQFVPRDFDVPVLYTTSKYKLVPLGPAVMEQDYRAYMSSIEHLRKTFSGGNWPHDKLTLADAVKDMDREKERFHARTSFAYAVLTLDGTAELGSVYIRPSRRQGYDAELSMWVTKEQFDKGFDAELFSDMKEWVAKAWPFKNVAYPKRETQ